MADKVPASMRALESIAKDASSARASKDPNELEQLLTKLGLKVEKADDDGDEEE